MDDYNDNDGDGYYQDGYYQDETGGGDEDDVGSASSHGHSHRNLSAAVVAPVPITSYTSPSMPPSMPPSSSLPPRPPRLEVERTLRRMARARDDEVTSLITGSRFHQLTPSEQQFVRTMERELREYSMYVTTLQDASRLSRYIKMVMDTAHRSLRKLRDDVERTVTDSWGKPVSALVAQLRVHAQKHALVNGVIESCRYNNGWSIGHTNPTSASRTSRKTCYKPLFHYYINVRVDTDASTVVAKHSHSSHSKRIVVRNPILVTENACQTFVQFIDVGALTCTEGILLTNTRLLWLGTLACRGVLLRGGASGCQDHDVVHLCVERPSSNDDARWSGGVEFDFVWLPECHVHIRCQTTRLCDGHVSLKWEHTSITDQNQRAYIAQYLAQQTTPSQESSTRRRVELRTRPFLAYELLVPMQVRLVFDASSCLTRLNRCTRQTKATVVRIDTDGVFHLSSAVDGVVPGAQLALRYESSYVSPDNHAWHHGCDTLLGFFERAMDRYEMMQMQAEEETHAIRMGIQFIENWIATQHELIDRYVGVVNIVARHRIRVFEQAIEALMKSVGLNHVDELHATS